jgi:hypothetical protein
MNASAIDPALSLDYKAAQGGPSGSQVFHVPYPPQSEPFPRDLPPYRRCWSNY